ncbi:hypothetical protein ABIF44_005315 [Bradyrhizobium japonicum]|nr:hypothetical protein [Bradyrhizobium japonicum]BAL06212.1 hypothetical protein BJ6T_09200 [Bradyrhizobium japonicum USDA 6]MCS3988409.1 hypothetical protein [Bradyrhizobium japonicum]MCS4016774.1 hypothetical protein [Bradyrhizobium japonicum]MCS4203870.1 hypothetical protein [Bradyrhizobium japonicum]
MRRSCNRSLDGVCHTGARHGREPGIHNHRIEFDEDSRLLVSPRNRRLWLWIPGSRSARPGMTGLYPGYWLYPGRAVLP